MADTTRPDIFDSQPESSGNSNDDFEKLDAPSSGFYNDGGEAEGPNAAADAGAYDYDFDHQQEAEISSTAHLGGEEEAEEDRYNAGASEADNYAHSSEPLISLGNDDPFQVEGLQPSAPPVSEISQPEPLIDFDNSTGPENDILASFASSTLPSSKIQESISANSVESQKEIKKEVIEQNPEETSQGNELGNAFHAFRKMSSSILFA
ncbi:reticulon-like protein [Elysia marginata]|uniref:Reticulon-like protein n=1 Tax=Elysia marginata TaxID=1093978 RepID=A0AAV4JMF1_9GAST|nr:reticulon-like protein [Elysia marginata]